MDRLYNEGYARTRGWLRGEGGCAWIPVDMYETDEKYVVKAAIPGVRPEDIEIGVVGTTLTIKGQPKYEHETETGEVKGTYAMREMRDECYYRQVDLPAFVNADKADASFENGVLMITIPKAEVAKPKRIPIGAAAKVTEKLDEFGKKIGLS